MYLLLKIANYIQSVGCVIIRKHCTACYTCLNTNSYTIVLLISCGSISLLTRECVKSRRIGCHNLKFRRRNSSRHIVRSVSNSPDYLTASSFRAAAQYKTALFNVWVIKWKQCIKNLNVLFRSPYFDEPVVCFADSGCS